MDEKHAGHKPDSDASNNNAEPVAIDLNQAIEDLKTQAGKSKSDYLYLLAEFENYKKNVIKERSDLRKYGSERLLVDLLNVMDLLEAALSTDINANTIESFKQGVHLTAKELRTTLQRFGVEELPAEGHPFDPSSHEALSSEETAALPEGYVSKVFKKPYKLHERVIRPGQVVVARSKSTQ